MKLLAILLILGSVHLGCMKESLEIKKNLTFVATKNWQEIKEDQAIPKGLHVRVNLQTGKKEAKLLDEKEDTDADDIPKTDVSVLLPQDDEDDIENDDPGKSKKIKLLEEVLHRRRNPNMKILNEDIKLKFRSYEELKKSIDEMNKAYKTDDEIIIQLMEEFHNITLAKDVKDPEVRINTQTQILKRINYLTSQFDIALVFVEHGGLDYVILPTLVNQTNLGLKVEAMRILGIMSHNNPQIQIKVYERNIGSHLTQILMTSTRTEELSAALFAFGSLLRKFPHAQQRILSTSGTQALVSVLGKECELKIKAKAATIIGDIIVEKELVLSKSTANEDPLAAAQYAELSFPEWLQANYYCETMDALVTANLYEFLEAANILEYFIHSLENTRSFCSTLWSQSPQFRHILLTLKNRYSQSEDEYRVEISQLLKNVIDKLYPESIKHDEF